jgi:CRP/FNR family transcriptional regulator, cyclic AMP receptor protein
MTDPALIAALRSSRLGAELSDEQAIALAENLSFRDLQPGEVLVREGTSDNHLYVIVDGALGVVRRAGSADAVALLTLTTGDLVGELSFIDETPHYASLVSIGPTRVFGLERERLESLLLARPELVYRVMRAIVRTVHEIQRRISMQSAELTNYIYKQHGKY